MEGYSVTEAASILGVPTERVWELLARGVLSGAAEGETGMRVYLQPRPAPAPPIAEPGRPNGDAAREPERELSPFRELLTEFRNLTERYGQALLALGEARGEVAALRSRVDLLEARMDLRLPTSAASTPWPAPMAQPTSRGIPPPEESDAVGDDESDVAHDPDEERPARRRRHRRATENFAEALARAEDPTRPELPGAAETAAALAALRADGAAEVRGSEGSLPRELPAADEIPMADESDPPHVASEVAPSASGPDVAPPAPAMPTDEPETDAPLQAEGPGDASDATANLDDDQRAEVAVKPEPETAAGKPEIEPEAEAGAEPEPEPETEPEPEQRPEPEPEPATAVAPEPEREAASPASEEAAPITWDPQRYSVDIGEPDWFVEEEPPPPTEVAEDPDPSEEPGDSAAPGDDTPPEAPTEPTAATEPTPEADAEETMLWFGKEPPAPAELDEPGTGADEMEVVGSQPPPQPPATARAMPGSRELDEALAALDALAGRTRPIQPAAPSADATSERAWPAADRPATRPADAPSGTFRSGAGAESPRLAATPASRAYRRLRRIFPG